MAVAYFKFITKCAYTDLKNLMDLEQQFTNSNGQRLQALLTKQIVFLDGAMGTMIQGYHLREEDFRDLSTISIPMHFKETTIYSL